MVVFDKSAEQILRRSMEAARRLLPEGQEIVVHKNNSDGKGNSYGCHENYLMDRSVPFHRIVGHATAHFVSRQIFTGSGKIGCEAPHALPDQVGFQLTQRADFFEAEVGLETTLKRPIVNTRDEPHADAQKYRRLHVIVGDANLSEVATFLKVGTTALVLAMVEDDFLPRDFAFQAPVHAMRQVSYDLTLAEPLSLADGSTATALEIQWELLDRARKYAEERGLDDVGGDVAAEVLRRWEHVLSALETDPDSLADQLDWVAKKRLLDAYRQREDLEWSSPKLGGAGPAVPRPAAGQVAVRTARDRAAQHRCRGRAGYGRAPARYPRLLPRAVPAEVARGHRRRQLGLVGLRRRLRSAPPGADDGTDTGNRRPRRYLVGHMHHARRSARQTGFLTGSGVLREERPNG